RTSTERSVRRRNKPLSPEGRRCYAAQGSGGSSMSASRTVLVAAALLASLAPCLAESADETITRWYAMLIAANEDGLAKLLSDDAEMKRPGVDMTQPKAQFLGTMSEWRIAIAGGGIRHKVEKTDGDTTTVRACYDFADNDILMRETFRIVGGLIVENTQTEIGDDCD